MPKTRMDDSLSVFKCVFIVIRVMTRVEKQTGNNCKHDAAKLCRFLQNFQNVNRDCRLYFFYVDWNVYSKENLSGDVGIESFEL